MLPSRLNHINYGVQTLEFDACVMRCEVPVGLGVMGVATFRLSQFDSVNFARPDPFYHRRPDAQRIKNTFQIS